MEVGGYEYKNLEVYYQNPPLDYESDSWQYNMYLNGHGIVKDGWSPGHQKEVEEIFHFLENAYKAIETKDLKGLVDKNL